MLEWICGARATFFFVYDHRPSLRTWTEKSKKGFIIKSGVKTPERCFPYPEGVRVMPHCIINPLRRLHSIKLRNKKDIYKRNFSRQSKLLELCACATKKTIELSIKSRWSILHLRGREFAGFSQKTQKSSWKVIWSSVIFGSAYRPVIEDKKKSS